MKNNPFCESGAALNRAFFDWRQLYPASYDKYTVDPYTKLRIILLNGAEFESNWYKHQLARHCADNDIRRDVALTRRVDQQQQKRLAVLKPKNESILEHTIGYEMLAVDLTAGLAKRETNQYFKQGLDFALLEDFDHLYRYANLLELETGESAKPLVGGYAEIMPARPTISHHRHPCDGVMRQVDYAAASLDTILATMTILAAEQQTMNFYMNVAGAYPTDIGRRLYQEIGMVEEQHVTQYESYLDTSVCWLEGLLWHEYLESYLYYSAVLTETDAAIRQLFQTHYAQELVQLQIAAQLLQKYENKSWQDVIPNGGEFPEPLALGSNIDYVRCVLKNTADDTLLSESIVPAAQLTGASTFAQYQQATGTNRVNTVPSHNVINKNIAANGMDYRFETQPNPIPALGDRTADNVTLGRVPPNTVVL